MSAHRHPHPDCGTCNAYLSRRSEGTVLASAVTKYARLRGMTPAALLVEFVRGVHARHLAGLSLETRRPRVRIADVAGVSVLVHSEGGERA